MSWSGNDLREEIEHFTVKQEVLASLTEGKMSLQKVAPNKLQELKGLEEQKTKEPFDTCTTEAKVGKMGR